MQESPVAAPRLGRLLVGDALGGEVEEQHGSEAPGVQLRDVDLQAVFAAVTQGTDSGTCIPACGKADFAVGQWAHELLMHALSRDKSNVRASLLDSVAMSLPPPSPEVVGQRAELEGQHRHLLKQHLRITAYIGVRGISASEHG